MQEINKKRVFIALNLPPEIKEQIAALVNDMKEKNRGVKWVNPEGLHLTLHFLGDLDEEQIKNVQKIMQALSGEFREMNFIFKGIGAFPNLNRPRVIFLQGEQINGNSIFKLQKILGEKLSELGMEIDKRSWKLHITLGRVKLNYKLQIKNYEFNKLNFTIDSFELMESELRSIGAQYTEIVSFKL